MSNKRNLQNISTGATQRFIDDVAALMMAWGLPQAAARLYGYLLLRTEPSSLDQIADDLGMSKSNLSVAARLLERTTLVRRVGERGTKRAFYEIGDNFEGMLVEQNRILAALGELLRTSARSVASGPAIARMKEISEFCTAAHEQHEALLRRWRSKRRD